VNIAAWVLAVLIAALASLGGGYWRGHVDGMAASQAVQDHKAVGDLAGILDSHTTLIASSNEASRAMRQATALRQAADRKTTEEFRHALSATADSRAGCVFPADVMRQLQAAHERAATAAALGVRGALPAAGAGADQP